AQQCRFYEYCSRLMRENFVYNLNVSALNYLNKEELKFSANFARFITERNVEKLIEVFDTAARHIYGYANGKIVNLDVAIKVILLLKS
ncbi:MAG: DNA polymerase III subunit delta, partial [Paramuribaculum sp.]|nr:DNA polymerase III subunit delta [Paramuribaculum sp.]